MKKRYPIAAGVALAVIICLIILAQYGDARGKHRRDKHKNDAISTATALTDSERRHAQALYADTCIGCHGPQLQGAVGPSLIGVGQRYSQAKIERIAQRGKGKNKAVSMPAGLVSASQARLLARWLVSDPQMADDAPGAARPE